VYRWCPNLLGEEDIWVETWIPAKICSWLFMIYQGAVPITNFLHCPNTSLTCFTCLLTTTKWTELRKRKSAATDKPLVRMTVKTLNTKNGDVWRTSSEVATGACSDPGVGLRVLLRFRWTCSWHCSQPSAAAAAVAACQTHQRVKLRRRLPSRAGSHHSCYSCRAHRSPVTFCLSAVGHNLRSALYHSLLD